MQSLPRELTLTPDNKVAANPIGDLATLRTININVGLITVDNKVFLPLFLSSPSSRSLSYL